MKAASSVIDSELPRLKQLAGDLLAIESPEVGVLDQIALLAAAIASRSREAARQLLLDDLTLSAQGIFPAAAADVRSRLAQAAFDDLAELGGLLDRAVAAAAAFRQADSGLMAAREKGDYAAMAPLAIEADSQKKALATASGEFADRLGLGPVRTDETLMPEPEPPAASASPAMPEPTPVAAAPLSLAGADTAADALMAEPPAGEPVELERSAEAPPERGWRRALIRQMRPADAP
jgi:hypothetical protein